MSKVILSIASTIDGYIARENGSVDFLDRFNDTGEDYGIGKLLNTVSAIVMGNTTFQQYSDHEQFFAMYEGRELFIFSRNSGIDRTSKHHDKVTFVHDDPATFLQNLPTEKDIWLLGGSELITSFLEKGLIDEFVITMIPTFIGHGIPLFTSTNSESQLEFVKAETFNSGVVNLHYKKK